MQSMETIDTQLLNKACEAVQKSLGKLPDTAIILGSGLGALADLLMDAKDIKTRNIPGYPASTVQGHVGRWVKGYLHDREILAVQGRIHGYEGHENQTLALPVNILASSGVKNLIITNAAGAINRYYAPGDFMVIDDQINLSFGNPLFGINNDEYGPRFPDMCCPFSSEWIDDALAIGRELGIKVHRGVYIGVRGPMYETAAEIRMYERIGADAVGMSTIPEVLAAVHRGMNVLGISCISNMATGITAARLSHDDVTEVANRVQEQFIAYIKAIIANR